MTRRNPRRLLTLLLLPLALLLVSSNSAAPRVLHPAPAVQQGPVGAPAFGLNTHLATRYPDPDSMPIAADTIAQLGVTWVREDLHWHRVQRDRDVWDWTFTDAAVRELARRDINILGVLGPAVGWGTPYASDDPHDVSFHAPDPDEFVRYARAVVTRYRRYITHWEIWNEPDNPIFWQPEPDPRAYAALLMRTSRAIKEIDPDAQVLIGGFNPFDTSFVRTVADAGAWDSFDILAVHPYVDPHSPEEGNMVATLDAIRALSYQFGEKPIWVTEVGWSSGPGDRDTVGFTNEEEQASYLIRSLLLLWSAGVERSFWYMLKDDAHNPYGLLAYGEGRTDFRPALRKPAFAALRTLNQELTGTTFVERRDLFDPQVLLRFASRANWRRVEQPNGELAVSRTGVARLNYNFSTSGNDYLVFERVQPVALPGRPYALGLWVYGDGTEHVVRVWLRDAEGELLQYKLGIVGVPGWRFISTPIGGSVDPAERLRGSGNGRLDFPAHLEALVLDDAYDAFIGQNTVYMHDLMAIGGREVYDLRFAHAGRALDVIWSPPGLRVALDTEAAFATLVDQGGSAESLRADTGRLRLTVRDAPVFLWHEREHP